MLRLSWLVVTAVTCCCCTSASELVQWHDASTGDVPGSSSRCGERNLSGVTEWGALSGNAEQGQNKALT